MPWLSGTGRRSRGDGHLMSEPPETTLGEWIASPEGQAQLEEHLRARLEGNYEPTPFEQATAQWVRDFWRRIEVQRAATPVLREYLARSGWFLTGPFPSEDVGRLAGLISAGEFTAVEAMMCDYARHRATSLEHGTARRWPERAPILREAFAAHREGRFALSIPVFLGQAEGVAVEILGEGPFRREKGVPRARQAYRALLKPGAKPDEYPLNLMFASLDVICSWNEHSDVWREKRVEDVHYGALNRHSVLHGSDLTYPTEPNSLRAMLLLEYLAGVSDWLERPR